MTRLNWALPLFFFKREKNGQFAVLGWEIRVHILRSTHTYTKLYRVCSLFSFISWDKKTKKEHEVCHTHRHKVFSQKKLNHAHDTHYFEGMEWNMGMNRAQWTVIVTARFSPSRSRFGSKVCLVHNTHTQFPTLSSNKHLLISPFLLNSNNSSFPHAYNLYTLH